MISKLSLNLDAFSRAHYFKLIRRNSPSSPLQRSSSSRKRELQRRRRKKKKKKRNSPLSLYGLKVEGRPSTSAVFSREEVRSDNNEFRCRPFRPSRVVNSTSLPALPPFYVSSSVFLRLRSRQIFISPFDRLVPYRGKDRIVETLGFRVLRSKEEE